MFPCQISIRRSDSKTNETVRLSNPSISVDFPSVDTPRCVILHRFPPFQLSNREDLATVRSHRTGPEIAAPRRTPPHRCEMDGRPYRTVRSPRSCGRESPTAPTKRPPNQKCFVAFVFRYSAHTQARAQGLRAAGNVAEAERAEAEAQKAYQTESAKLTAPFDAVASAAQQEASDARDSYDRAMQELTGPLEEPIKKLLAEVGATKNIYKG
eukprot:1184355-Prorocentrum_minimum.AAC.1